MAEGNKHLGYKAALNAIERDSPGQRRPRSTSTSSSGWRRCWPTCAPSTAADGRHLRRSAARRRAARSARSAGWSTRRRRTSRSPSSWSSARAVGGDGLFAGGDKALLIDAKQRRYLVTLVDGGEFHSHNGFVPHAELIGRREGIVARSTRGATYTVLRPTLEDFVVEMPRGAQVIYPKDLAPICMLADIGPGVRVFESGVGSGALSMTMLRWGAEIVGYELREDFANRARANVRSFLGEDALERYRRRAARLLRRHRRARPRPGRARPARAVAGRAPRPGGAASRRDPRRLHPVDHPGVAAARRAGQQGLERGSARWRCSTAAGTSRAAAVRPDHRMVAHTGFLTTARLAAR